MYFSQPSRFSLTYNRYIAVILGALIGFTVVDSVWAIQDDAKEELGEIGMALKAAVRAGAMTGQDARAVWGSLVAEYEDSDVYAGKGDNGKDDKPVQSVRIGSIPLRLRALLQPEFTRRDLVLLRDAIGLENEQLTVIESLLEDYMELFELASRPLRDAMGRYRRAQRDLRVARILGQSNLDDASSVVAQALERYAQDREAKGEGAGGKLAPRGRDEKSRELREYRRKLMGAMETMEVRLEELRGKVEDRLAEVAVTGENVTSKDLIRLAEALEDERTRLRIEFSDYLALIANVDRTDADRMRFESALARVLIEHELGGGRLGGESINMRATLASSSLPLEQQRILNVMIGEREGVLAQSIANRVNARIERELIGLTLLQAYDRAIQNGVARQEALTPGDVKPYIRAYLAELQASIVVRDELLDQLGQSYVVLSESNPEQALKYRDIGLRQGFKEEMREMWAERALAVAFRFEDLETETLAILVEIFGAVETEIQMLREDAVADRIASEPRLYRSWMEGLGTPGSGKSDDDWAKEKEAEIAREERLTQIDDRTEEQLMSLLTLEQFEQLPRRSKGSDKDGKNADAKKPAGKDSGKGNEGKGTGRSTGRSRAGNKG